MVLVVYLVAEGPDQARLLGRLGTHPFGRARLYVKRLGDPDAEVLDRLVAGFFAEVRRRFG